MRATLPFRCEHRAFAPDRRRQQIHSNTRKERPCQANSAGLLLTVYIHGEQPARSSNMQQGIRKILQSRGVPLILARRHFSARKLQRPQLRLERCGQGVHRAQASSGTSLL